VNEIINFKFDIGVFEDKFEQTCHSDEWRNLIICR